MILSVQLRIGDRLIDITPGSVERIVALDHTNEEPTRRESVFAEAALTGALMAIVAVLAMERESTCLRMEHMPGSESPCPVCRDAK